jgi:hypothetical protein
MQEQLDTVLVIRPIHKANTHAYDYVPVEAPRTTAEDQLGKPDAQRHITWRGVRYATEEEKRNFYNLPEPKAKIELSEVAIETIESSNNTEAKEEKKTRTKRSKEESI